MNKKDIALTVGGILATMVVSYLIYQMEQRNAAAAAANAAAYDINQQNQLAQESAYLTQLPMFGSYNDSGATNYTTGTTDTSAGAITSAAPAGDPTISAILGAFGIGVTSSPTNNVITSAPITMSFPTATLNDPTSIANTGNQPTQPIAVSLPTTPVTQQVAAPSYVPGTSIIVPTNNTPTTVIGGSNAGVATTVIQPSSGSNIRIANTGSGLQLAGGG